MLTNNNYLRGFGLNEQIKYNITYDKTSLFDVVYSGLAARLLEHPYSTGLTELQKTMLEKIINN